MISKTAYEKATGMIRYTVSGEAEFLIVEETDEIGFVDGVWNADTHVIIGGVPEVKSQEDMDAEARERAMQAIRDMRNIKLAACDWTQVSDAPVDRAAWAAYRQALRDLPSVINDPSDVIWPTPPSP